MQASEKGDFSLIRSVKSLDPNIPYVTFSNLVYNAEPLKMFHPAGYQVVESVKNREVDRYIYGSAAS